MDPKYSLEQRCKSIQLLSKEWKEVTNELPQMRSAACVRQTDMALLHSSDTIQLFQVECYGVYIQFQQGIINIYTNLLANDQNKFLQICGQMFLYAFTGKWTHLKAH